MKKLLGYPQRMRLKDDLKLLKYDDYKTLSEILTFGVLFHDLVKKDISLQLQGIINIRKQTV